MEETFITFPTAKLAKEKGFDELCLFGYKVGEYIYKRKEGHRNSELILPIDSCTAPTQNLLQKWLRDKYNIVIVVEPLKARASDNGGRDGNITVDEYTLRFPLMFECSVYKNFKQVVRVFNSSKYSYDEVLEVGLQKALELLPNKK